MFISDSKRATQAPVVRSKGPTVKAVGYINREGGKPMSFITEALTAIHTVLLVDPIIGTSVLLLSVLAMGLLTGPLCYYLGKAAGKEASDRWFLADTDAISKVLEAICDPWDLLFLEIQMEKQRLDKEKVNALIVYPDTIKA